jgi:phosphate starvation-inducible PhoH-like protein
LNPPSSANRNSNAAPREQVTLEFKRNNLLSELSGPHGRHFVRIEQRLDVKLAMRGNLVAIEGAPGLREQAATVLRALYDRIEGGESVALADVDAEIRLAQHVPSDTRPDMRSGAIKTSAHKLTRPRNAAQAAYLDTLRTQDLTFGIGPAGTGKTYLAAAFGAHLLYERRVDRLILSRPALEAGERLGFLPGDLKEKIDPYLRPLYDALFDVIGEQCVKMMETGIIEVAPLAFMRGRTLTRAFVILDEAQNTTPAQMKMFLTRLGEDSRMVVTGDLTQSDLPIGPQGLAEALSILEGVEGVGVTRFAEADVVRHALVTRIVGAYAGQDAKARKRSKGAE